MTTIYGLVNNQSLGKWINKFSAHNIKKIYIFLKIGNKFGGKRFGGNQVDKFIYKA